MLSDTEIMNSQHFSDILTLEPDIARAEEQSNNNEGEKILKNILSDLASLLSIP